MSRVRKVNVVDLGLRNTMSPEQILAEASKWDWDSFILIGRVNENTSQDEEEPSQPRLMILYHPDTDLGEGLILAEIAKTDAIQGIMEDETT